MRQAPRFAALLAAVTVAAAVVAACGTSPTGFGGGGGNDGGGGSGAEGGGTNEDGSMSPPGILGGGVDSAVAGDTGGTGPGKPACNDAACACTQAGGMWSGTVCTLVENPGNVPAGTVTALGGGGTADSAFKFVYPYDQTVFPRGLLSPTLQFAGDAPTAMLVHIHSPTLDYKGYFGASNPARAQPSANAWLAITLSATAAAPLTVDVTKTSASGVTGPATETWPIAQGSLRGIIYYETYGSAILGGFASVGIMKIAPGASAPVPIASGCGNVCHTASADGSTLVSSQGFGGLTSVSYDLKGGPTVRKAASNQSFIYGGLSPDGSVVMSSTYYRTWFGGASHLYDTTSGAEFSAPGWDGTITNAAMPAFSPDGHAIVFNREDTGGGHSLATMAYNATTHTFSALADVASDPSRYLGWPAFTPDATSVVYHAGSSQLFETDEDSEAGAPSTGDLYVVDLATKKTARLDNLDGYSGGGTYLPAADPDLSFAPTILPEAVGGYFWVVFTSHRSYGNTLPSMDNSDTNGKLWVAAFDIGAAPGTDASHPAFYLDGQESGADNLRGFWVANPCAADGAGCTSGDQCCGGYCDPGANGSVCSATASGCSSEYDKCAASSDCCSGLQCIDGKCAIPTPK